MSCSRKGGGSGKLQIKTICSAKNSTYFHRTKLLLLLLLLPISICDNSNITSTTYFGRLELKSDVVELPFGVPHPQHEVDGALVLRQMLLSDRGLNAHELSRRCTNVTFVRHQTTPSTKYLIARKTMETLETWGK